jgi:hypothetical protein
VCTLRGGRAGARRGAATALSQRRLVRGDRLRPRSDMHISAAGTLHLFDRNVVKYFRKDGARR